MLLTKKQLAYSLCKLVETDYDLLSDIITEYVWSVNDNKLDDLEQHVNNNMNELM
jgi:hypothetical protein